MTDDKKKEDKDRKKVSDEELEDVAGGAYSHTNSRGQTIKPKLDQDKLIDDMMTG